MELESKLKVHVAAPAALLVHGGWTVTASGVVPGMRRLVLTTCTVIHVLADSAVGS